MRPTKDVRIQYNPNNLDEYRAFTEEFSFDERTTMYERHGMRFTWFIVGFGLAFVLAPFLAG